MTPDIAILLKVTFVLALGLVAARLAGRARASVRHLLLASTLGALIALPLASALVPDVVLAVQLPRTAGPAAPSAAEPGPSEAAPPLAPVVSSAAASIEGARAAFNASAGVSMSTALRWSWAAGAVLLLAVLANALRKVRAIRRSGIPWLAGQTAVEALARENGIRRPVTVILHEHVPAPVTCGWGRPTIVLPVDAREWSQSDLQRAFVHELEHVRRGDWPVQLAARAICAAYWFHPLVWIAWRQLRLECERACDDAVVNRDEQTDYAEQLVTLAERLAQGHAQPVLSMAHRSDLSVRVSAVLDRTQLRGRAGASIVAATVAVASVFVLVIGPVHVEAVPDPQVRTTTSSRRIDAAARALNAALVEAASKGDIDEVSELLSAGVDVNAVVRGDGTALLVAARGGDIELVRFLLDRGADVDIGVAGDGNPLIMAARGGHLDVVKTLLDRGADVNAAVPGDGNALIMGARGGHLDVVEMLLDRGALVDDVVDGDENALITGSASGHLDVVRLLVSRGANVNARVWANGGWPDRRREWRTPLNMARRGGHAAVVRYLQSVGGND
jgi:beta-lactamase regulating signal transducer with metallopeptidase domain